MSVDMFAEREERPAVEVRVFRYGELIQRVLCESVEEAASVVEHWSELDGTECEVDDLSVHHHLGDVLEPEPAEPGEDEHGHASPSEQREQHG